MPNQIFASIGTEPCEGQLLAPKLSIPDKATGVQVCLWVDGFKGTAELTFEMDNLTTGSYPTLSPQYESVFLDDTYTEEQPRPVLVVLNGGTTDAQLDVTVTASSLNEEQQSEPATVTVTLN